MLALGSNIPAYIACRGATLMAMGRHKDALGAYDHALALDSSNPAYIACRGAALMAMGRYKDALDAYDLAHLLGSQDVDISRNRDAAIIAMGSRDAIAHYNTKGMTLRRLGRYGEALIAYDQVLVLDPNNPDVFMNRGDALMAVGRDEDALAAYEQALHLHPGDAAAYEKTGIALAVLGYPELALAQFNDAEHVEPQGTTEGKTWAGAVLWHLRDTVGARRRFASVSDRMAGCISFRTAEMEAIALCGLGQPDEAEKHLLDAIPFRTPGDDTEPRTIYELLADPPLPGIDRLRMIVANDTWVYREMGL